MENELVLKVDNVKKRYRLGVIGGGTLQGDIQSWWARIRGKEDPNSKIGTEIDTKKGSFMALDGINFEVKKGERLGIIGGNGAGKSTTLKILSRVTAPTEGTVYINGRISSMLEVGTGFHPELTGRENIYLNGAILGMSKEEVDRKIEDIIEFSECRQFIDTPVKRYSSGMYVKLAFSVAAHLDSEILIMDEVLAVGDMKFQQKCLKKMQEVSENEGRTVLYVSHNMNTIRQLCDRCIVLNKGNVIFEGDVENAIQIYLGVNNTSDSIVDLKKLPREKAFANGPAEMVKLEIDTLNSTFEIGEKLSGKLSVYGKDSFNDVMLKIFLLHNGLAVTTMESPARIRIKKNETNEIPFEIDLDKLAPAQYTMKLVLCRRNSVGGAEYLDVLNDSYMLKIVEPEGFHSNQKWSIQNNGYLIGSDITLL